MQKNKKEELYSVQLVLKVNGTLQFLLLEHFLEHEKSIRVFRVPNIRGY